MNATLCLHAFLYPCVSACFTLQCVFVKEKKNCACSSVVVKIPSVCLNQMCVGGVCGKRECTLLSFKLVSVSWRRNHQRYSRPSSWLSSPYLHGPTFNRHTKLWETLHFLSPEILLISYVNIYIEFPLIFCVYLISQVPNPPFHQTSGIVYNWMHCGFPADRFQCFFLHLNICLSLFCTSVCFQLLCV